jgi:hypothetical protein
LRIFLASLGMGVIVWITSRAVEPVLHMEGRRVLGLILILLVAGGSYIMAGRLLGAFSLAELRQMMRQAD